ncbi:uncharacterized protein CBL_10788 [Carabus blaptoides fortunei]
MEPHKISIPEFFTGKNIFITGATGFMGKALIEKLLRSCPAIGTIYVLVRPKKGKELQERLQQLTANALYDRLKVEQPNLKFEDKIKPLAGEMTALQLGLSATDRQTIVDYVHVIYHVAASVRFDDSLKDATIMNVRGTREVCQLSLDTKNLQAHIHVSTAFANCDRPEAGEVLYPPSMDWRQLIEIAENFNPDELAILGEKFISPMPNTYCFTKNVAEHVVNDMCMGRIPAKIFRPSIVVSTMNEEPVVGWIDNFNGPVGILTAYSKGIMRTIYASLKYKPDYIPVDVATKALIACTWDLALRAPTVPEVLQCTSYSVDWIRPNLEVLTSLALEVQREFPLNDIVWYPSTNVTTSTTICYVRTVLFMLLPSLLVDGLLKVSGRKPILTRLQKRMYVAQLALRYFLNNEWLYSNDNLLALQKRILAQDFADWDYDFATYDNQTYLCQCALGCRRYLLKEPDDTLPRARRHAVRMYWLNIAVQAMFVCLLMWIVCRMDFVQGGFEKISGGF